jgi:anti-sigma B factor antagonist
MNDKAAQVVPAVVVLPDEIDVTNADQVYEELVAALVPGLSVLIADMTGTQFCDSSGVHALMHANESASARDVRMRLAVSPTTSVRRVLQLIGVGLVIPVHESLKEALDAV